MNKFALAVSAIALATTAVWAGAVEDREALMKERAQILGALTKVAKGETAFDAAAVAEQFKALQANADKTDVDTLWAAGTTGNTADSAESSPKIWEDMAGFKAAEEKYEAEVKTAATTPPADAAAVGATLGAIGKNGCAACHEAYRISKN